MKTKIFTLFLNESKASTWVNKAFIFFVFLGFSLISSAQTMTSATVLTPICPLGTGTVQVSFTGVSYPFVLVWFGSNIAQGQVTITGSPQTITMTGQAFGGSSIGTNANFYYNNFGNYLGTFPLGINFDPVNTQLTATCAAGVTFTVNNIKGGTGPYTLVLYNKITGTPIISGSSPLNVAYSTICPLNGNIGLKVEDSKGCYASLDSMYIYCFGLNVQITSTPASCTNGTATVSSVTGGVPSYTYAWSNGASSSSLTGLSRGTFNCIVTDSKGCTGIGYTSVPQNPTIGVNFTSAPATCNNADGQSTVFATGGAAPYTYFWDNGSTTQAVTNLLAGIHSVKIKDKNGCTGESYTYINTTSPVLVTFSSTPSLCTSATGTAVLSVSGGQTPYTYSWDGLSSTSNTATGLAVGQYSFKVTDANSCERRGIATIPPVSLINATINAKEIVCPSTTGSVQISAFSLATPLTYKWSNGAITSSINNVTEGYYSCVISDINNCKINKAQYLGTTSNIKLGFNSTPASCIFASDGAITVSPSGGTAPYNYKWSNGATTATITGLEQGFYWVQVSDAAGCRYDKPFNFVKLAYNPSNNSCYCTIEGTVYNDLNSNCTQDLGEDGISDVLIYGGPLGYTTTNINGNYSFKAPLGSYTITEIMDKGASLSTCQSNNINVSITSVGGGCTKNINFSNQLVPSHDIIIALIQTAPPRPGNTYNQTLYIKNNGNLTETNVQTSFMHNGQLQWQNSTKAPWVSGGKDYFNINPPISLKKGETQTYKLDYFAPTNIPLGTIVYFRDSAAYISPIANYWITNEETPWNNISDMHTTVVNSYDPNSKTVYPQGEGEQGKILLSTKDFRYVVNFENNGTASAQKIVITDTLDSDLDIETFRTIGGSHSCETRINNGVVTFTFDNINLDFTPLGVYKASAQGFVTYTIKAKSSVVLGTKLESRADIYFDYNPPIATNKPINTYSAPSSSINNLSTKVGQILAYPNPTSGILKLELPESFSINQHIEVFNSHGQLIKKMQLDGKNLVVDLSSILSGLYLISVKSDNGESGFIKMIKTD